MSEENAPQKERFLQEVEQKLLRRELDARLLEDGLIHVRWNEKPLCSVDRDGIVRFRPADITGPEVDKRLRTVIQLSLIHISVRTRQLAAGIFFKSAGSTEPSGRISSTTSVSPLTCAQAQP